MIRYEVVVQDSLISLKREVEKMLAQGWKLQGGICDIVVELGISNLGHYVGQAMIKEDDV